MSNGRYSMRGFAFQGWAFQGFGLAGSQDLVIGSKSLKITQPRASGSYTGRRYGSFRDKLRIDFMHGSLKICPHVIGDLSFGAHLSSKLNAGPHLHGDIRTNP